MRREGEQGDAWFIVEDGAGAYGGGESDISERGGIGLSVDGAVGKDEGTVAKLHQHEAR